MNAFSARPVGRVAPVGRRLSPVPRVSPSRSCLALEDTRAESADSRTRPSSNPAQNCHCGAPVTTLRETRRDETQRRRPSLLSRTLRCDRCAVSPSRFKERTLVTSRTGDATHVSRASSRYLGWLRRRIFVRPSPTHSPRLLEARRGATRVSRS